MNKPTVEDIIKLAEKCKKIYGKRNENFKKDEEFYELEFAQRLNIPKEYKNQAIVLPTARDMPDTFVDHIDISNTRVFVNRKGISKTSVEEAEMMRKFYLGIIHRTNVESDISPWRVAAKHYAVHGLAVLKTVWDADQWLDKPPKEDKESEEAYGERIDEWRSEHHTSLPIVIQAIHPSNVMPDPSGGKLYVVESGRKMAYDVLKMHPHWKNPLSREIDEEVDYVGYWDKTFRCELMDGEPILKIRGGVVKHNYGFIPHTLIESGLGNLAIDAAPDKRYVGILRYIFDILLSESRDYSIADIILSKVSWGGGFLEGDDANAVTEIKQSFGTWNPLPKGVIPHSWAELAQLPPDMLNLHLARTHGYITAHAAPNVLRGLPEPNIRSGAHERVRAVEAAAKFQYSKDAFQYGTANVLTKCALLQKNVIPDGVRLWSKTPTDEFDVVIDKKKMKEPFTCYVEFAPISEEDEYRRHDDLERLITSGVVTKQWARTQMSNVDPIAMQRQEEKELLKASPMFNQLKDQYLSTKFQEALQKLEVPTGAMPVGEEGSPEAPEAGRRMVTIPSKRAQPGSPEEMQNRLKAQRSQKPMQTFQGFGGGGSR